MESVLRLLDRTGIGDYHPETVGIPKERGKAEISSPASRHCRLHLRLFAAAAGLPGLFEPDMQRAFVELGEKAAEPLFLAVVMKGVVAGWLIALMVWLLPAAGRARFLVIVTVTYVIAIEVARRTVVNGRLSPQAWRPSVTIRLRNGGQ
jgi:hypothetical protein